MPLLADPSKLRKPLAKAYFVSSFCPESEICFAFGFFITLDASKCIILRQNATVWCGVFL
jgi:hypothetical protein